MVKSRQTEPDHHEIWIDVKETVFSALTLCGVLVAAGYYNSYHQIAPRRWKRETLDDIEVPELIQENPEQHHFFNNEELKSIIDDDVGNITESTWKQMQLDLGIEESEMVPFEIDPEDISAKKGKQKMQVSLGSVEEYKITDLQDSVNSVARPVRTQPGKPKRFRNETINLKRFKLVDIPLLHVPMLNTFSYRQNVLLKKFVDDAWIWPAKAQPVDTLGTVERANLHVVVDEEKPGEFKYPDFRGNDKTHPQVQKLLDEYEYKEDGSKMFEGANTQLWFVLPAAVPLFPENPEAPINEYNNYYKMVENFKPALETLKKGSTVRLSIGLFHKGGIFAPRGAIYRPNRFPWSRIENYYKSPRTATSMPYLIDTAESMLKWMARFGPSTPSAGQDCHLVWVHQDYSADAERLLDPESFGIVDQLYTSCNVMHVFVGVEPYNEATMRYASAIMPGLQMRYARDPDFSGVFFAKTLKDVSGGELQQKLYKYITLIKGRGGCRVCAKNWNGWQYHNPNPNQPDPVELPTATPIEPEELVAITDAPLLTLNPEEMAMDVDDVSFNPENNEGTPTAASFDRGLLMNSHSAPHYPEIDSCCGHDKFTGFTYDSELMTCCMDGKVKFFDDDGEDPCAPIEGTV